MDKKVLFEEIQASGNASAGEFFKVASAFFIVVLLFNLLKQGGHIDRVTAGLLVGFLVCFIAHLLVNTKMVTQIREDGIYVRYPPFQPSFSRYSWDDIIELYLRKFDPVSEYKGWGIKIGPEGRGYIVSGDTGLQISLRDHSKVLVSTQKPEEMASVLKELNIL